MTHLRRVWLFVRDGERLGVEELVLFLFVTTASTTTTMLRSRREGTEPAKIRMNDRETD